MVGARCGEFRNSEWTPIACSNCIDMLGKARNRSDITLPTPVYTTLGDVKLFDTNGGTSSETMPPTSSEAKAAEEVPTPPEIKEDTETKPVVEAKQQPAKKRRRA